MAEKKLSGLVLAVSLTVLLETLSLSAPILIKAQYMEYDESGKNIFATGGVRISSGNFIITGNELKYDIEKAHIIMKSSVALTDENSFFLGDEIEYNLKDNSGEIYKGSGKAGPNYFRAREIIVNKDNYRLKGARITTCDLYPPHYYFRVSDAELVPRQHLYITNLSFWLRSVPLFYFPYFPMSLKERHDCWWITPAFRYDGLALSVIYGFPVTKYSYAKLYYDGLSRQGIGRGVEYDYNVHDNYKGTLYAYGVQENKGNKQRWDFKAAHQQKLSKTWSLQGNVEFLSDQSFNGNYVGDNWYPVMNELPSNLGFTRQTNISNLRLYTERYDIYDSTAGKYVTDRYSLPKIDFTLYPFRPKNSPVSINLTTSLGRNYTRQNGFLMTQSVTDTNIYREIKLSRNDIFTPKLGFKEDLRDTTSVSDSNSLYLTKTYMQLGYRHKLSLFTNLDLTYNYTNRYTSNTFSTDYQGADYGIEANNLGVAFFTFPTENITLRAVTSYDFSHFRNEIPRNFINRLSPVTAEFNYFRSRWALNLRQVQDLSKGMMNSFQGQLGYTVSDKTYLSFGVSHNMNGMIIPEKFGIVNNLMNSFAVWLSSKWHVEVATNFNIEKNSFNIQQQTVNLYRDMHCWEATLTYRKRVLDQNTTTQDYFLNVGMKAGRQSRQKLYDIELEQQFYQWRKEE